MGRAIKSLIYEKKSHFGVSPKTCVIDRDWIMQIKNEIGKKPIGIKLEQDNDKMIGQLIFNEEEKDFKPLIQIGQDDWSTAFNVNKNFINFIDELPYDVSTFSYRHPKRVCRVTLMHDYEKIIWEKDEELGLIIPSEEVKGNKRRFYKRDKQRLIELMESVIYEGATEVYNLKQINEVNKMILKFNIKYEENLLLI